MKTTTKCLCLTILLLIVLLGLTGSVGLLSLPLPILFDPDAPTLVQATPNSIKQLHFAQSPRLPPQPVSPLRVDTPAQLPRLSHDLLFHNGQMLQIWRTATGQIEPLVACEREGGQATAQPVEHFVVEPDGRGILLLQRQWAVDGAQHYALRRYDRTTQRVETLVDDIPYLYDLSLSPDGVWMTYNLKQQPSPHRYAWWARLFRSNTCWCGESPLIGTRYVQRLHPLGPPIKLTTCAEFDCSGVLGWLDEEIVWQAQGQFWRGGQWGIKPIAHDGMPDALPIHRAFVTQESPHPHSVLARVDYSPYVGYAVLDLQRGRAAMLPNTHDRSFNPRGVTWLRDGRLLLARRASQTGAAHPTLERWSVHLDGVSMLQFDESVEIPVQPQHEPGEVVQLADGRIAFALLSSDPLDEATRGLYLLDVERGELRQVNHLPPWLLKSTDPTAEPCCVQLAWLPDGRGAIATDARLRRVWYIPTDGSLPYDLGPWLGGEPRGVAWLASLE
jgi:hypothetical protein